MHQTSKRPDQQIWFYSVFFGNYFLINAKHLWASLCVCSSSPCPTVLFIITVAVLALRVYACVYVCVHMWEHVCVCVYWSRDGEQ